jgi:hypothetical protein
VVAVRVVQMAFHQIVGVVAVRHRLMAAAGAVAVALRVAAAVVVRCALGGVGRADRQGVFLDLPGRHVMEVAVVEVIHVAVVLDGRVAAAGAVLVRVRLVLLCRRAHLHPPFWVVFLSRRQFVGVFQRIVNYICNAAVC